MPAVLEAIPFERLKGMDAQAFGLRLKELREAAGLTQAQLAEKAGLSQRAVSHLEQQRNEPIWSSVIALAEALGVTPMAFLEPPSSAPEAPKRGRPPRAAEGVEEPRRHGKKR